MKKIRSKLPSCEYDSILLTPCQVYKPEISNTIYVNTPLTPAQVEYLLKNLDEFVEEYEF